MFSFNRSTSTRAADDTLRNARPLGTLTGSRTVRDAVGSRDKNDYYSFKLTGRSSFNLTLKNLQNNVDVALLSGNRVLTRSAKPGKKPEAISATLEPGTYFLRVIQKRGNSSYRLSLTAAPVPPPPPERFRFLAQAFSGGSRLLKLDTLTGETTVLASDQNADTGDDFMEVASFGNEVFVTRGFNSAYPGGLLGKGLFKVDPNMGTLTLVGDTGVQVNGSPMAVEALGFTSSGALYGVINNVIRDGLAPNRPALYSIDKTTGKATFIAALPPATGGLQGVDDIVYDPASGRFLASFRKNENSAPLLSIGLAGDVQELGRLPARLTGLFFQDGTLNGFTYSTTSVSPSRRVAIDLNRKTNIAGLDFFEATELPFKPPTDSTGYVTGAG